jgi:tyrosinase
MIVRKNQATLTADERSRFVAAIKQLKANGTYDHHVHHHLVAMRQMVPDQAHGGPAFFPWHRECLRWFEQDLRSVDPSVSLPYWDFATDNSPNSSIWAADFMGGDGRAGDLQVMTGPFAYSTGEWTLTVNDTAGTPPYLRRAFGTIVSSLPTTTQVNRSLSVDTPYDAAPWNGTVRNTYRSYCEQSLHNVTHRWMGGTMLQAASPNDPVFWMLHCMMDRLWGMWQKRWPNKPYLPTNGGPTGHNLNDPMWPWSSEPRPPTPATMLGYKYDDQDTW